MPQMTLQQAFDLALQHQRAGQLAEAEQIYRQILAAVPENFDALHNLAGIAQQTGRLDDAIQLFRQAISINPTGAEAHNNLGTALAGKRELDGAILAFRQALALRPKYPAAMNNLASALNETRQFEESIALCRRALALAPNYADAFNNLGIGLQNQGQLDEAVAAFHQAIAARPEFPDAFANLATALRYQSKPDESIAAGLQALALKPYQPDTLSNLGLAYADQGRLDEAIVAFRQALALNPSLPDLHSILIFNLYYASNTKPRSIADEECRWNDLHAAPLAKFIEPHLNSRIPDRRLKIGYVSPDFRDHAVGRNILPLFQHHDHTHFEITSYSNTPRPDSFTQQFQQKSDRWRNIAGQSDEQVANQIREDQIDILIDLALHTSSNRLLVFARKPAPVQVTFAGYPASTGLTTIDYRLSDPYLDPAGDNDSLYAEKTIRLPHSFWCYDPLDTRDTPTNPLPAKQNGYLTFGCLNKLNKINDPVLNLWARVLDQVKNSRLLLLAPPGSHRQRILDRLAQFDIAPTRIDFAPLQPRSEYLRLYHRVDLGLDTFPYNGHTTSLDSLWMGVPVVTLIGRTPVSRAGFSQLSNLSLTDLAAETPDEFVQIAANLANDLPRLSQLRQTLRHRMKQSPLMDARSFARDIESALRQMWQSYCSTS
jgi:protein O-GlcNAc transferase